LRQYKDIKKTIVERKVCVGLYCDICGKKAEYPHNFCWEWGGMGTGAGKLEIWYSIDGDYEPEQCDLCYTCGEALLRLIERHSPELKALIEKEKRSL